MCWWCWQAFGRERREKWAKQMPLVNIGLLDQIYIYISTTDKVGQMALGATGCLPCQPNEGANVALAVLESNQT